MDVRSSLRFSSSTPRERRARGAVEALLAAASVVGLLLLATARGPPATRPPWRSIPVDLARDGPGRLRLLPGLGPIRVQAVLSDRANAGPLARVEDLRRIRGFGPKTVEALRAAGAVVLREPVRSADAAAPTAHGPEPPQAAAPGADPPAQRTERPREGAR